MADSTDRLLGRLEENHRHVHERLVSIETKLDSLQAFKWKMVGGSAFLSVLLSIVAEYLIFNHGG